MCNYGVCKDCIMINCKCEKCPPFTPNEIDKMIEKVEKWKNEHTKTRESEFLKAYPNANAIEICPQFMDKDFECSQYFADLDFDCEKCCNSYWLAEI